MAGIPKLITIADPGAGNLFTHTVPDNIRFQPLSLSFNFDVSNTSPDRTVGVQYSLDGDAFYTVFSEFTLDDNESADFTFDIAGHGHQATGPNHIAVPLADIILTEGAILSSVVDNISGTDEFTGIFLYGYFWLTPQ